MVFSKSLRSVHDIPGFKKHALPVLSDMDAISPVLLQKLNVINMKFSNSVTLAAFLSGFVCVIYTCVCVCCICGCTAGHVVVLHGLSTLTEACFWVGEVAVLVGYSWEDFLG